MKVQRGFTLIEMLFVLVVIGVLIAIAVPNYREYVAKARRVEAQALLFELAQFMERYYTANGRYVNADGDPPALPFTSSPKHEGVKMYDLVLSDIEANSYTLSAVPRDTMLKDRCGTLQLTSAGVKGIVLHPDPPDPNVTVEQCWRR